MGNPYSYKFDLYVCVYKLPGNRWDSSKCYSEINMIIPGDWVPAEVYWKQLLLIALTHLGNLKLPAKHTAFCKTFLRDTKLYPKVSAYIDWYWKWLTWLQILVGACEQNLIISWFFASRFFSWGKKKKQPYPMNKKQCLLLSLCPAQVCKNNNPAWAESCRFLHTGPSSHQTAQTPHTFRECREGVFSPDQLSESHFFQTAPCHFFD